jgi:hypothetical protein
VTASRESTHHNDSISSGLFRANFWFQMQRVDGLVEFFAMQGEDPYHLPDFRWQDYTV